MFKRLAFVALCGIIASGHAFAGDTVTVNIAGGATQTVSSSTIAAAINTSTSTGTIASGGGESSIASITQDASTGAITVTTTSGQTYTVSSAFIGSLLGYYK